MTRTIVGGITAVLCAIVFVAAQPAKSAQSKPAAVKAATPVKAPTAATPAKAAAPARTTAQADPSVTLTGCLRADGSWYKLTDLEGGQAPKGRNWKTGFVTKSTKDIEVAGASPSVRLTSYVGHRISVVGVKDGDRHFKAQSIKQLATSC